MTCIAIIPARSGSTRIPNKNIRDFHGKPIIAYSIETAIETKLFDRIIVSTDHPEIAKVVDNYDVEVHKRSAEMSKNEIGTQEVTASVLKGLHIDCCHVCCIYATAPLMSACDLEYGYNVLSNEVEYAFAVGTNPLCDAGQFYWGSAEAFRAGLPLIETYTAMIPIDDKRVCDINTEEDWLRAEKMYTDLHFVKERLAELPNNM